MDQRRKGPGVPGGGQVEQCLSTDFYRHRCFHTSPAVSSDLILILRDSRGPGAANGRPLIRRSDSFWEIRDNYLLQHERQKATLGWEKSHGDQSALRSLGDD
jgi:hypothetical protein